MSTVNLDTISPGNSSEPSSEEDVYNQRKSEQFPYKVRHKKQRLYSVEMTVQAKTARFVGGNRDGIASVKPRKPKPQLELLYMNENFGTDSDSDVGKRSKIMQSWKKSFFKEKQFALEIEKWGLTLNKVEEGSTSFFRAIADQVYGDRNYHAVVREQCLDHIEANEAYYASFLSKEFTLYVKQMRMTTAYPSAVEMQAVAELYQQPLAVYTYNCEFSFLDPKSPVIAINYYSSIRYDQVPIEPCYKSKIQPMHLIRVAYHNDQRYTSLRKSVPTVCQTKVSRKIPTKEIQKVSMSNVIIYKLWWTVPATTIQLIMGNKKANVIRHIRRGLRCPRLRRQVPLPKERKIIGDLPYYVYPSLDSISSWMTVGIQAHRKLLAHTMSNRQPYFYSSPFSMVPRKISQATITSHSITAWSCIVSHRVSTAKVKKLRKEADLGSPSTSKSKADLRERTHAKNTCSKYHTCSTRTWKDLGKFSISKSKRTAKVVEETYAESSSNSTIVFGDLDEASTSKSKSVMDLKEYNTSDEYGTCSTSTFEGDYTDETSNKHSDTD